jgi:protein-glutamine gamma-glutamyltransferase
MPTDFWFRFSTYLTLALSCACLGYSEWELLPAVSGFAGLVILFLIASFLLDRRFELSLGKANLLGLVIGIGAALWMVYRVTNPPRTGPMAQLGWPTTLLPVVAPVLMVLIPAKLLRPMHVGDWWAMHGVALAAVGLASAMIDDVVFVILLVAYSVVSAWSLVLFFYRRGGGFVPPIPNRPVHPPPQVLDPDLTGRGPRWMFARSTLWLLLAGLIALPLFFTLPRPEGTPWLITKQGYEIGQSTDATIDINHGGTLQASDEVAYYLLPTTQRGEVKTDLAPEQLWRARALCEYKDGAWSRPTTIPIILPREPGDPPVRAVAGPVITKPEEFGPDGYLVEFAPMEKERHPVLASPIWWVSYKHPVHWVGTGGGWQRAADMSYIANAQGGRLGRYRQACAPPTLDGLGKPFEVAGKKDVMQLVRKLDARSGRGAVVQEYATSLLGRLIREGKLPAAAKLDNDPRGNTSPDHHERIARLFSDHLGTSGEFEYSTTITRQNTQMDPVEDFIQNTRSGNCELFATALVMLLRAVDVPAQYVTGYKGWETDDDGNVVIRRRQAHAWVEVLVSRPPPADFKFHEDTPPQQRERVWHWLSLDATTGEAISPPPTPKSWWSHGTSFLLDFIIGYDKEKQKKAIQDGLGLLLRYGPIAVGVLLGLFLLRRLFRRWRRSAGSGQVEVTGPAWYARMTHALESIGITPTPGETPREYADRAATVLVHRGVQAADVPPFVTSKLYRVRYAGLPLELSEVTTVESAIERLEQALREQPAGGGQT